VVYLADPAAIKTVFAGDPAVFHAGEANAMLAGLVGNSSVLLLDDDLHRDRRRLMMAPFARDAVARQGAVMAEIAAENIAGWPVGVDFPVAPKMSEITLEVILRTVVGASDPARLAALRTVMPRVLGLGPWATLAIGNPRLMRHLPWRYVHRRIEQADRLLFAEIADRVVAQAATRTDVAKATGLTGKELDAETVYAEALKAVEAGSRSRRRWDGALPPRSRITARIRPARDSKW
jgi:cytochrome P450